MAETQEQEQLLPPLTEQAAIQQSPKGPTILGGITAELERLAALRFSGALDEEEFRAAKARLLEGSATSTVTTPEAPVRPVEPPGVISTLSVVMHARDKQTEFMNAQELASHLGVTARSVRRWIERGELPAEKPGRCYVIRREDGERMRHRAFGSRAAEDGSQLEGITQSEVGERMRPARSVGLRGGRLATRGRRSRG
jgi:excisionase family DNA binding protein